MIYATEFLHVKENMYRGFHHIGLPGMRRELLLPSTGGSSTLVKPQLSLGRIGGAEKSRRSNSSLISMLVTDELEQNSLLDKCPFCLINLNKDFKDKAHQTLDKHFKLMDRVVLFSHKLRNLPIMPYFYNNINY